MSFLEIAHCLVAISVAAVLVFHRTAAISWVAFWMDHLVDGLARSICKKFGHRPVPAWRSKNLRKFTVGYECVRCKEWLEDGLIVKRRGLAQFIRGMRSRGHR